LAGRVAPRAVEWFVGRVPTVPTRRRVLRRTPGHPRDVVWIGKASLTKQT
jgi:hypothetical protein